MIRSITLPISRRSASGAGEIPLAARGPPAILDRRAGRHRRHGRCLQGRTPDDGAHGGIESDQAPVAEEIPRPCNDFSARSSPPPDCRTRTLSRPMMRSRRVMSTFLVMEYVEGVDLARKVWEEGALPIERSVRIHLPNGARPAACPRTGHDSPRHQAAQLDGDRQRHGEDPRLRLGDTGNRRHPRGKVAEEPSEGESAEINDHATPDDPGHDDGHARLHLP